MILPSLNRDSRSLLRRFIRHAIFNNNCSCIGVRSRKERIPHSDVTSNFQHEPAASAVSFETLREVDVYAFVPRTRALSRPHNRSMQPTSKTQPLSVSRFVYSAFLVRAANISTSPKMREGDVKKMWEQVRSFDIRSFGWATLIIVRDTPQKNAERNGRYEPSHRIRRCAKHHVTSRVAKAPPKVT